MRLTNLFVGIIMTIVFAPLGSEAVAQKRSSITPGTAAVQQPIYNEYRGVHIGMPADEVRAKLGEPASKADDQDYYIISESEAAQIVYDAQLKTKAISVDYMGGVGAPDPKTVVGGDLEVSQRGLYKLVRYENLGYWVSYNRTAGPVVIVTITIQKAR